MNIERLDAILAQFKAFHEQDPDACPGPDNCLGAAAIRDLELYIGEQRLFEADETQPEAECTCNYETAKRWDCPRHGIKPEAIYPEMTVADLEPKSEPETLAAISAARDSLPLVIEP